jgi:hypothetical protein
MSKYHECHPAYVDLGIFAGYGECQAIHCAICGKDCVWKQQRGWYCEACDAFTETDVEVEEWGPIT